MTNLLQMTIAGSGMVLVTVFLRQSLRDRLPRTAYLCFWAAALMRLLSPVMFRCPFSLFRLCYPKTTGLETLPMAIRTHAATPNHGYWLIWLAGMLACAFWFFFRQWRACRALRGSTPLNHPDLQKICAQAGLKRPVRIHTHAGLAAPVTYGFLRPVALLPDGGMSEDSLRFALLHELCHVRRLDCLWKTIAALTVCIHWFNPFVWLLFILLGRDLEIACDKEVLRRCPKGSQSAYAHTLLDFAERSLPAAPISSHFSQTPLEERIFIMMNSRKTSIAGIALATALVLGTTSAFAAYSPADTASAAAPSVDVQKFTGKNVNYTVVTDAAAGGSSEEMEEVCVTFSATDSSLSVPGFSLDEAKCTTLADGSTQYEFPDGTTVTILAEDTPICTHIH